MSEDRAASAPKTIESLDVDTCMALLAGARFGRIAYVMDGRVEIRPVNYVFHEGTVVIRTDYGDRLDLLAGGPPATFQVDDVNAEHGTGWSVVLQGTTEEVAEPGELERLRALDLQPWAPGAREHFLRVLPSRITGRRIGRD